MHVTASGMQTYFTLDKVQSMLINGGGVFLIYKGNQE
jgi:hypothetical protein